MSEIPARAGILVVDDDDSIREIVRRVLKSDGHIAYAASNGAEALEQFDLTLPDLVMLDVEMPLMDGWETLKRLRQVSDCPVIMVTVYGSTEDITKGLEWGADDYLVKPFGVRELIARVNTVLRRASPVC